METLSSPPPHTTIYVHMYTRMHTRKYANTYTCAHTRDRLTTGGYDGLEVKKRTMQAVVECQPRPGLTRVQLQAQVTWRPKGTTPLFKLKRMGSCLQKFTVDYNP